MNDELTLIILELKKEDKDNIVVDKLIKLADKTIKLNREQETEIKERTDMIKVLSNMFLNVKKENDSFRQLLSYLNIKRN